MIGEKNLDFYKRVEIVCSIVPYGKVVTYGQIALLCGKPRNARQVGYALSRGRCGDAAAHRVVNGQGFLTGAAAFAYPGLQKRLLQKEGVEVSEADPEKGVFERVDLSVYGWANTLDEALLLQAMFEREGV